MILFMALDTLFAVGEAETITLTPITTGFNTPIGIDHHQPTNRVVMSVNYPSGLPYNFELVAADGTRNQFSNSIEKCREMGSLLDLILINSVESYYNKNIITRWSVTSKPVLS